MRGNRRSSTAGGTLRRLLRFEPLELIALSVLGYAFIATAVWAQPAGETPLAGTLSYTAEQAEAGRVPFLTSCSGCHDTDLAGVSAPPLKGPGFARWFDRPSVELFRFIATQMPAFRPASLQPETYAAIFAFILSENGLPSGAIAVPAQYAEVVGMAFQTRSPQLQ